MNYATAESLVAFETRIRELWETGELPFLVHLCGGNERELVNLAAEWQEGDWVFSTHRNHYHALCAGVDPARLEELIRTGNSMFVFDRARNFYSSSILAGTCGIAAGVAWGLKQSGSKNRVWCFLGDGAEEQGHFYEAALFVEAQRLPCTFIVEDNARQVDTPLTDRRGHVSRYETNIPLQHFRCVTRIEYVATYPHAGSGCKHQITFNPAVVEAHRRTLTTA